MNQDAKISDETGVATTLATALAVTVLAPELLPGMAIGVAAMLAPKFLPTLGNAIRPFIKTALQAGHTTGLKARELVAEATEQIQDLVAEVTAEQERNGGSRGSSRRPTKATGGPRT